MKSKIAIIVPRFDKSIIGGIEKHAYQYTMILKEFFDVTVITTTALDYRTWKNHFPVTKGIQVQDEDGALSFRLFRFPVDRTRKMSRFDSITRKLLQQSGSNVPLEEKWLEEQGPVSKALFRYLESHVEEYNLFFFFTYLYYPVVKGLEIEAIRKKSILVPALHREFTLGLNLYKKILRSDLFYSFNTPEEKELFEESLEFAPSSYQILGGYPEIDLGKDANWFNNLKSNPSPSPNPSKDSLFKIVGGENKEVPYFLCMGRLDAGKGVWALADWFSQWRKKQNSSAQLVFIGPEASRIPSLPEGVDVLGMVDNSTKLQLLQNSVALIHPSKNESLSFSVLEAMGMGVPVIVNGGSDVLVGHCVRSQAGLWFLDEESLSLVLSRILSDTHLQKRFSENGKLYIEKNYTKNVIQKKLITLVSEQLNLSNPLL